MSNLLNTNFTDCRDDCSTVNLSLDMSDNVTSWFYDNSSSANTLTTNAVKAYSIAVSNTFQIIYLLIGCFGFVSNLLVVLVIALYKPMQKQVTNLYIANQSLLDACVAGILVLSNIFQDDGSAHRWQQNVADQALCQAWYSKMPLWCMVDASSYSIVVLTYERYIAVLYPIWHKTKFSSSKLLIRLPIAVLWLIIPLFSVSYNVPSSGITADGACSVLVIFPSLVDSQVTGVFIYLFEFLIPAVLIIFGYAKIALVLHSKVEASAGGGEPEVKATAGAGGTQSRGKVVVVIVAEKGLTPVESAVGAGGTGRAEENGGVAAVAKKAKRNESMAKARGNVIKTAALIGFFFIFCWAWNQTYYLIFNLGYNMPYQMSHQFRQFTIVIGFVNCCVNPIIYSFNYTLFKKGVMAVFCRKTGSGSVGEKSMTMS